MFAINFTLRPLVPTMLLSSALRISRRIYYNFVLENQRDQFIFHKFRQTQSSVPMFLAALLFAFFFSLFRANGLLRNHPSYFAISVSTFSGITVTMGVLLFVLYIPRWNDKYIKEKAEIQKAVTFLEVFWLLLTNLSLDLMIISTCEVGPCPETVSNFGWDGCNRAVEHQMPEALMIAAMMAPVILHMTIKGVDFKYVLCTWCINMGVMTTCMVYYDMYFSYGAFFSFFPFSLVAMFENQRQNLSIFHLTQAQQELLIENERVAAENHTTEMRHMIGNVAHDLKTVSVCECYCSP